MARISVLYTFEEDLFADAVIKNPWPVYARMREQGPVAWLPDPSCFALVRHHEVQRALRCNADFISGKGVASDQFGCDFLQGNTVASDGERHTTLRKAMAQPMLPGELGSIREKVQQSADDLIDALVERGSFDAVTDLARILPMTIVRSMVGLPEFGQEKMLQWAAAAFDVLGIQNQRGRDALPVIAEMREFINNVATRETLKPGSWTMRIHSLVDQGLLPADLAPFAIRDYINPSLDTTISATAEMIFQLAKNPLQWEKLKQQPELANNAVNEAVRLGTPIRMFSRHTSKDLEIAGVSIKKNSRVLMLFASANRDERRFKNPDLFDIERTVKDHVGFGSGVHMCVGMHLAQLEMEALLKAMIPRVATINTGASRVKLNNTICAYGSLECTFERETRGFSLFETKSTQQLTTLTGKVVSKRSIAKDVVCVVLSPIGDCKFPEALPGAHVTLHMTPDLVRSYSLTESIKPNEYTLAIQRAQDSRGGSRWIHEVLAVGDTMTLSPPANLFPLRKISGVTLLIAGGIGLTPLLAMAWELHLQKRKFELHIFVREYERMPFYSEYQQWPFADRITVYANDHGSDNCNTQFNVTELLKQHNTSTQIYTCGPSGFMTMVRTVAYEQGIPESKIHQEHFGAEIDPAGDAFTVVAARSNQSLIVPPNKTILQVLTEAGIQVQTSCQQGVCGSCLTTVLSGTPDHRDMVQTESEKANNKNIAVCCSRALTKTLKLDL